MRLEGRLRSGSGDHKTPGLKKKNCCYFQRKRELWKVAEQECGMLEAEVYGRDWSKVKQARVGSHHHKFPLHSFLMLLIN